MKSIKHTLLKHSQQNYGLVNIGDHIQSCAAEQFMPKIDFYTERDKLNMEIKNPAKVILNGWFTDAPENWPPHPQLIPLFISFHLQPKSAEIILSIEENIQYLKKHAPIGCRDYQTVNILKQKGIDSYYSFCLTSTLGIKFFSKQKEDKIYFVDPLYSYDSRAIRKISLKSIIKNPPIKKLYKIKDYFFQKRNLKEYVPKEIIEKAETINHYVKANKTNSQLYNTAKRYIRKYSKAKLVVTSRIHCAIPCLALKTPVLFLLDGLLDENQHMSRFRGVLDHINILTIQDKEKINSLFGKKMNVYYPDEIDWNSPPKNPESFSKLSKALEMKCRSFILNQ